MKAIISDFDGTLAKADKTVGKATIEAIERLIKNGNKFALCTGRMTASAHLVMQNLPFKPLIASYNGAEITDLQGNVYYRNPVSAEGCIEILEFAEERGINCQLYSNVVYVNKYLPITGVYCQACGCPYEEVGKLSDFVKINNYSSCKVMFLDDKSVLDKYLPEIERAFNGKYTYTRVGEYMLDFMPLGVNKGSAIEELCKMWGIGVEDVVAVGDDYNDIAMIKTAGVGVAVANANDDLKQVADYITHSDNENDAVKEVIDKFF